MASSCTYSTAELKSLVAYAAVRKEKKRKEKKRKETTNQINSTQAKSNQINVGIAFVSVTQHRTVVSEWCGRWTHPHTAPAGAPSPPEIYLLAIDLRLTF